MLQLVGAALALPNQTCPASYFYDWSHYL